MEALLKMGTTFAVAAVVSLAVVGFLYLAGIVD